MPPEFALNVKDPHGLLARENVSFAVQFLPTVNHAKLEMLLLPPLVQLVLIKVMQLDPQLLHAQLVHQIVILVQLLDVLLVLKVSSKPQQLQLLVLLVMPVVLNLALLPKTPPLV